MKTLSALMTAAAMLALAGTAQAQTFRDADPGPVGKGTLIVTTRATGVLTDADNAITTSAGAATGLKVDVDDDYMPTLGFTYFVTDHFAIEAILGATRHEVRAQGPGTDVAVHETWVLPPVVTVQYRPTPNAQISPYVGAGVNYMLFFGGDDRNGFDVDLNDGFGLALQAGADIALQGPWSLNIDAKKVFFDTDASINGGALRSHVDLDPWVVSIGIGRRF